eukprot:g611.t1
MHQCSNCATGTYGDETGRTAAGNCKSCNAGKYNAEAGQTASAACSDCVKGRYQTEVGKASCEACPGGKYLDDLGKSKADACKPCGKGRYSSAQVSCKSSDCAEGKYGTGQIVVKKDNDTEEVKDCTNCPVGRYSPAVEIGWGIVRSIASLVLVIGLLVLFLRLNRKAPNGAIKPFINASQMIQVLLMFEADWPASFSTLVSIFGSINLDAVALASPTCMGIPFDYHRRLGTMVGVTALVLIAPWAYAFVEKRIRRHCRCGGGNKCARLCQRCCGSEDEVDEDANEGARIRRAASAYETTMGYCLRDMILIILLVHPTLSGYALNFFNCKFVEELGGEDSLNGLQGNWYMTADFSLRCYDATYNGMLALAILLVVFFAVGIPVLFAFLLRQRRDDLEDPKTKKLLGMLYSSYKPEAYWFESVQMGFKLALWVSLALFKDDPQLKIAIALLVCFVQVILHAYLRPFNSFEKNASQALGICTAFTVSFGGLVINYLNESMRNAYLLSNKELHASLKVKLGTFKAVLEVVVYLTLFGYGIVGVIWVVKKLKKNEDRMREKCGKYCKCLGIRVRERHDDDEEEEERSRAAVNPSSAEEGESVDP